MILLISGLCLHGGEVVGHIIVRPHHQVAGSGQHLLLVAAGKYLQGNKHISAFEFLWYHIYVKLYFSIFVSPHFSSSKPHVSLLVLVKSIEGLVKDGVRVLDVLVVRVNLIPDVQNDVHAFQAFQQMLPRVFLT